MPFSRYVEIGRVALINYGGKGEYGKLVVIVDVVDQNRVSSDAARGFTSSAYLWTTLYPRVGVM